MTCLLDVSTLLARLWETPEHHERVTRWQTGVDLAVCPLTELGFLRISTQPIFGASVVQARKLLRDWRAGRKPRFIPCDLETLHSDEPKTGKCTTDFYLASLAAQHGMELATLDESIGHKAVLLIPA